MAANEYSHAKRDELDAPLCGTFRASGPKYNTLLTKPTLGGVKPTCYDLPSAIDFQHEYGLRQERDGVTSADVVGGWAEHEGTGDVLPPRDFMALNKKAAEMGAKTAKDIATFRQTNDARLKLGSDKPKQPLPYDSSTTFGRSTVASENFSDLMSHQHRFEWVATKVPAEEMAAAAKPKKPGQTKTSILAAKTSRAKLEMKEASPAWKLPAFSKVPPKVGPTG